MPQGTTASGMPVPASASAAARIVPSPPQTTTSDAPSRTARAVCPSPGSSAVVATKSAPR